MLWHDGVRPTPPRRPAPPCPAPPCPTLPRPAPPCPALPRPATPRHALPQSSKRKLGLLNLFAAAGLGSSSSSSSSNSNGSSSAASNVLLPVAAVLPHLLAASVDPNEPVSRWGRVGPCVPGGAVCARRGRVCVCVGGVGLGGLGGWGGCKYQPKLNQNQRKRGECRQRR